MFFAKNPAKIETINDINGDLVAYMRALRDRPHDLQCAIQLTPYARAEYAAANLGDTTTSDLERARHWWIQCTQSRSGRAGASAVAGVRRGTGGGSAGSRRSARSWWCWSGVLGAGVLGIVLAVFAVWMLAVVTWGALGGTVLVVSGLVVLGGGCTEANVK
ncbi:hypothetical protein Aple_038280 [Acrocarpospora pleiomorpha]|uniref:Uncharacterized protein n=1 Tax=Acrocarpospora pleiomorpha TaxID=90975 RepID=A0A5M3XJG5_9ACTN|nr:hypothetical protein [Acrocarpospora pleiomorpha]GES20932.1 hypothetical protein Aple_038280 [Acrocarpospora pleiomorpha]